MPTAYLKESCSLNKIVFTLILCLWSNFVCFPQEEIVRYKKQYEDMLIERNKFKQQCTQVNFNGIFCQYISTLNL